MATAKRLAQTIGERRMKLQERVDKTVEDLQEVALEPDPFRYGKEFMPSVAKAIVADAMAPYHGELVRCQTLLHDLDLGRVIHNSRFRTKSIEGPLWDQLQETIVRLRELLE